MFAHEELQDLQAELNSLSNWDAHDGGEFTFLNEESIQSLHGIS
jgi:hypothetical protein